MAIDPIPYVAAHRARIGRERTAAVKRAERAHVVADRLAGLLVDQFGAARVVLVGSLARGELTMGSDIDLVVWELPPGRGSLGSPA